MPGPGRSWPASGSGRRSPVSTPWWRWPAPPGAGSPACSTTWSVPTSPRSAPAGPRRPRRRRPCGGPSPPPSCWTGSPWGPGTTSVRAGGAGRGSPCDGLVLLDLPDFDSRRLEHRVEADRVLELVDVFVWVTDPQKYADARLHHDYLAAADRARRRHRGRAQPGRPAHPDGAGGLPRGPPAAPRRPTVWTPGRCWSPPPGTAAGWWTCSTGSASWWQGARPPCTGSRATCARSPGSCGPRWPTPSRGWTSGSTPAWSTRCPGRRGCRWSWPPSSGTTAARRGRARAGRSPGGSGPCSPTRCGACGCAPTVAAAAATAAAGWRPGGRRTRSPAADVRAVLGRSSLPPATPAARSSVELATRDLGDRAGAALPQRWADAVAAAATPPGDDLGDALDRAVMRHAAACPEPVVVGRGQRGCSGCWRSARSWAWRGSRRWP